MIAFLHGSLAGKTVDKAILEVNGVGFAVGMSARSLADLPSIGSQVQVHTYMQVREDDISLFGFLSLEEKQLFERLITVSGVGPKVALAALSSFDTQELSDAIMAGDSTKLSRIPGIGKKTAQRMILELQGVLESATSSAANSQLGSAGIIANVTEDLLVMGFTSAEAELACKGMPESMSENKALQYALKRLGEK